MGQCSGCFSVQSCQGKSEWPCCHGCLPPHPLSPSYRWVLGSHCDAGPGHCCCLPCHGWAVCCQGALAWLKLPTVPVEGACRPFNQTPAREESSKSARCLSHGCSCWGYSTGPVHWGSYLVTGPDKVHGKAQPRPAHAGN